MIFSGEDQLEVIGEPANERETKFIETYLKAAENVEMTDYDVEIAENRGTEIKHDSLMEYSNMQLDFIKVFGERIFVLVIGEFHFLDKIFLIIHRLLGKVVYMNYKRFHWIY